MQTGLLALELIAQINQIAIDTRSISREFALSDSELREEELLRILKHQGFKAKSKKLTMAKLAQARYPLPAIIIGNDNIYRVLLKVDTTEKKSLIFNPISKSTQSLTFEDLDSLNSGRLIILKHKQIESQIKFGYAWFFQEISKYRRVIAEVMLGSFLVQLFGLATPLLTQVILDKVIVNHAMNTLIVMALAFGMVTVFEFLLNITRNYIFIHTANKIDAKLGAKLFKHLFALPYVYFESRKVGNIVSRVKELDRIREFITNRSVTVIIDLFFSFVFLAMMIVYSPFLAGVVAGIVSLIGIIYFFITPALRSRLESKFQMSAQANSYLVEAITGINTVKSLAIEGSMQKRWEDYLGNYLNSSFNLSSLATIASALSGLLQKAIVISVLYLGVGLVLSNKMTIGQLIAFQMFSNQLTNPVLRLVNLWNDFQQSMMAVERLGDILNSPIEVQNSQAITLPELKGNVKFDNVCFKYNTDSPYVLKNLSFSVPPGASIGLVGRSGSGKSTLTKLIQRLYIQQEGAIYIDDVDTRHMNPIWLRYHIGTVLQENYLFSGTIRENIAMARPEASIEHIIEASQLAGAHEFITQLPEGYDTIVGERGSTLSGGQRQRIAIARALITDPRILIFDEATSALDYESERIIFDNMKKIQQGRTVFIVAHRLTAVQDCDIIFVLEKGQLVEAGNHKELVAQKGLYHYLYKQQEMTSNAYLV